MVTHAKLLIINANLTTSKITVGGIRDLKYTLTLYFLKKLQLQIYLRISVYDKEKKKFVNEYIRYR